MKTENSTNRFAQFAQFARLNSQDKDETFANSRLIPNEVYLSLPNILKRGTSIFELERERDVFLTGALGVLSGCFNSVKGLYASEEYYPNLNCFITGSAGNGKGAMKHSRKLGSAIHDEKIKAYKIALQNYLATRSENPNQVHPSQTLLYIPANTSSSAVIRHLSENNESGIICETEADTMTEMFKMDFGGYSDLIRKAFHHETISYSRKSNREYHELNTPKLSVVLSGTPDQVKTLIPSSENGLFSRMIFYAFEAENSWKSVAPKSNGLNLNTYFNTLSLEAKRIYDYFLQDNFQFELTEGQWNSLNEQFESWLKEITTFIHQNTSSIVKRFGLIQFRIAMILSILRHFENQNTGNSILCADIDFNTAQLLTDVYLSHSLLMFYSLPKDGNLPFNQGTKNFYDAFEKDRVYSREEMVAIGGQMNIAERTVGKYLKLLLRSKFIEQPEYGKYKKC